jgi:glycosyltransferase involved in cell wall biosynthesis
MNILFLMQTYIDIRSANAMYNSLVSEFVKHGHHVTIVASNLGKENTNLRMEGDGEVLRVKTLPLLKVNPILKGIANLLLSTQYRLAMRKYLPGRKFDLIVTPTPPITLTRLAKSLKRQYNSKLFLILRDIFPQNAVDLGMMSKRSLFYYVFRSMEKELYRTADAIGCMTEGNIGYIKKNNPDLNHTKLNLLPNWNTISSMPVTHNIEIIEKYNLKDKFIVVFGGNLGISQKVENLVDFAKIHQDKKDLLILVIGRGTHKKHLLNIIEKNKINSIQVMEFMLRIDYEMIVSISHVGFISLNENFTIPNTPSRTLSYYNYKKPVFAIVDHATDYGNMLEEDNSGFCCLHGDYKGYKDKFDRLYFDAELRKQMGENGYQALLNKYNPEITFKKIAKILSIT